MSDSVVSAVLKDLFDRYTSLDMAGCLFLHEFAAAIGQQIPIGKKIKGLFIKLPEQHFIDDLTDICKSPAAIYGHSYYSILRLLWLRFKQVEINLDNNPKVLELYRLIEYSMRYPLLQKVNYIVHNVGHMLNLHPLALPLIDIKPDKPVEQVTPVATESLNECPICMSNKNDTALISCGHVICNTCATHLNNTTHLCPVCRKEFVNILKIYI